MDHDWESKPTKSSWLFGGAALGALAMYFYDQDQGRRRRALVTDKVRHVATKTSGAVDVASRDLSNRLHGMRVQASRVLSRNNIEVDDQILVARVRQRIGRVISHPRAIEVAARQGCVTLSGPVLAHEKRHLMEAVRKVLGVSTVEDMLDVHEHDDGISRLQGSGKSHDSAMRESWPPSLRAAAGLGGAVLGAYGFARRPRGASLLTMAGLGLVARSLTNMPLRQMAGMRAGGRPVVLNKTIHIEASPETVFDLWSRYENFPHFMSNIEEVRDLGNGRSHWVVRGPAGVHVEWDAEVTESRRPEVLAWKSDPRATVQNSGVIRFEPDGNGTRVSVHLSYSPPTGVIGHAIAALFNGDPKREMDQDLMRMKQFIETGHPPHDAAKPMGHGGQMVMPQSTASASSSASSASTGF